jgi:hypothetical protein
VTFWPLATWAFSLFLMSRVAVAQTPEFGILTNQPSAADYGFDFDGRFVVWRDGRAYPGQNKHQIYARDLQTGLETCASGNQTGSKAHCAVSAGVVAWCRGPDPTDPNSHELWVKDLVGRIFPTNEPPRYIATVTGCSRLDISGDWLVWADNRTNEIGGDLHAENLRTFERLDVPGPAAEWSVILSGSNVFYTTTPSHVWGWDGKPMDWDVYRFDLGTRATEPVKVGPGNFEAFSVEGRYLLLYEVPSYNVPPYRRLWLLDLVTKAETLISENVGYGGWISGNLVVYQDGVTRKVMAYEISSGERCPVSSGLGGYEHVANNIAVWFDDRPPADPGAMKHFIYGRRPFPKTIGIIAPAGLNVFGPIGSSYQIEYTDQLASPHWMPLTNVVIRENPWFWADPQPPARQQRFYRAVPAP